MPGVVLTSQVIRGGDRVSIAGELSMSSAALLDAEIVDLYGPEPGGPSPRQLVLDLTDITFLDVMGLMALRRAQERASLEGGLRLGLPIANGPSRLLMAAVDFGWLPPVFTPGSPAM